MNTIAPASSSHALPTPASLSRPLVSIVVPTRNSARTFRSCARSIQNQSYPNIEVVVVDSFSDDDTARIAQESGFKVIQAEGNRAIARQSGVRMSKGDFIFFVDSDQEVAPGCVEILLRTSTEEGYDALVALELAGGDSRWSRLMTDDHRVQFELRVGLPRWFSRSVIERIDFSRLGAARHVHGEDRLIRHTITERGARLGFVRTAVLLHHDPEVARYFQKQVQNTATGTGRGYLGELASASVLDVARELNLRSVHRVLKSWPATAAYAALLFLRLNAQAFGVVAGRVAPHSW